MATSPARQGIRSVVVEPTSIKRPASPNPDRATTVASASQLLAAASRGWSRIEPTVVELAVDPPDPDGPAAGGLSRRPED